MGLIPVDAGRCAAVVTHLEMCTRPAPAPTPASPLVLDRWEHPDAGRYRDLFKAVGAPWLWYSRTSLDDAALTPLIHSPTNDIYAVRDGAREVGMLELDFAAPRECMIAYLGLVPGYHGQGHGRWLMAHALRLAWRADVERVWVHTCSLDHPLALGFYRAQGFVPFKRELETFPDPRLSGHLPRDCAPQIPLL